MERTTQSSGVPDKLTLVPRRAIIVDLTNIIRYIRSRKVLDVFSQQLGFEKFMVDVMPSYFDSDLDDFEDALSNYFDLDDVAKLEEKGIYRYDLHAELCEFQTFRDIQLYGSLDPEIQEEFLEYGAYISKWLSPYQAIIQINSWEKLPLSHPTARAYRRNRK